MEKQRILVSIILFIALSGAALANDNPFKKGVSIFIGKGDGWLIKDKKATLSGSGSGGFYHLLYDRKQLRLRITDGAEDSETQAKRFQHFSIEDIEIDGERLPLFQWCLSNQSKHSRFLQQGLKVKQGVCANLGEKGTFIMRLNDATLKAMKNGQILSFQLKPFRSSIKVNFDISGFSQAVKELAPQVKIVRKQSIQRLAVQEKCRAEPPQGVSTIKGVEYDCGDTAAKIKAEASVKTLLAKESEFKNAAVEAQQVVSDRITDKMLAICQKKWAKGEHRCYCEKFIKHAPVGIESDASCTVR